jgi:hypothetical protein
MTNGASFPVYIERGVNYNICDFDYNNMYAPQYVGKIGVNTIQTLAQWQQMIRTDRHSVRILPDFIDSTVSLELSDYSGLSCPFSPEVKTDISGYNKSMITNMGAYNGVLPSLDLGIQNLVCNDTVLVYPQTVPLKIKIENTGKTTNIDSATFGWSINGEIQPSYTWIASSPLGLRESIEIPLGSFSTGKINTFEITAWIENVNGMKDSVQWNDVATKSIKVFWINHNLNIQSIEQLLADSILCVGDYVPLNIKVANTGTLDYDFAANPVRFSIRVTNPEPYSLDTIISTGEIKSGEIATLTLTDMFPIIVAGKYDIKVWMDSINYITYDDTARLDYVSGKFGLPIDEDFSAGIPIAFASKGLNSYNTWEYITQGTGIDTAVLPQFGTGIIAFNGSPGSMSAFSTQQLDLSRTVKPALSFWYFHDTIPCEDYTDVRITVDGGTSYNTLYSLTKYDAVRGWRQYSMDLPTYAVNQCVILVFEAMEKSRSGDITQYIDRIRITARQDIKVDTVLVSEYNVCELENKELKVVLKNLTDPVLNYATTPIIVTLEVKETGEVFTDMLRSGILGSSASDTITLATDFDFTKGTYTFKAYFTSVLDVDRQNDTLVTSLVINPEMAVEINQISGGTTNCLTGESDVFQTVTIYNTGNMDLSDIALILQIDTGASQDLYTTFTETCNATIPAGDTLVYTFTNSYTVPWNADYFLRVSTHLACDSALIDTTTGITECVDMEDLYIARIDNPSTGKDIVGSPVFVTASIMNRHDRKTFPDVNISVLVKNSQGVQIGNEFTETIGSIAPLTTVSHTFTKPYTVPADSVYYLTVYIDTYDQYLHNDTSETIRRETNVGIESLESTNVFTLGQNIPNPANNTTRIDYTIPEAGEVIFHVHTISGQLLYSKTIEASSGANSIKLNTTAFAAGVYYYSIEYKGQKRVKRMSITK